MKNVKHAIVRGVVFRAHDRTASVAKEASENAQAVMDRTQSVIDDCRQSQIKFFDARRKVTIAAIDAARDSGIQLEQLDDSDEESYNHFSRLSTASSHGLDNTTASEVISSSTQNLSRRIVKGISLSRPEKKVFYNSVNKDFKKISHSYLP